MSAAAESRERAAMYARRYAITGAHVDRIEAEQHLMRARRAERPPVRPDAGAFQPPPRPERPAPAPIAKPSRFP